MASARDLVFSQHDGWILNRNIPRVSVLRDPGIKGKDSCDLAVEVTVSIPLSFLGVRTSSDSEDCTRV